MASSSSNANSKLPQIPHNTQNSHVSPNPIPPRTSSTGLAPRRSLSQTSGPASPSSSNSNSVPVPVSVPVGFTAPAPLHAVLRPVSSADWISRKNRSDSYSRQPSGPGLAVMQHSSSSGKFTNPEQYAHEDLNFTSNRSWAHDKERIVRGPYDYVISHPGKDFRAQLIAAFDVWLGVPAGSLEVITKVVGMLHESSLLIDDVQDSSELRRGFPVAHSIFGVAQTINSANYIYFVALQELQKLENKTVIGVFAEELVNLHRGQGMDLFWRDTLTCPTEEDYLEMVGNKTGGLFRLGIKLMQAESESLIDCVPLINLIGLIFQIRDDYMNLSSKEYSHNKGVCEDLTEGKFSFPVIHSIRSDPADLQLISILKQKTNDTQVKLYAVSYMESTGSFEYTRRVLATLIARARKMAEVMDDGQGRAEGINKILDVMSVE